MNMSNLPNRLKKWSEIGGTESVELVEFDKSDLHTPRESGVDEAPLDLSRIIGSESSCETESAKASSATDPRSGSAVSVEPGSNNFIKEMFDKIAPDLTDAQIKKRVEELLQESTQHSNFNHSNSAA